MKRTVRLVVGILGIMKAGGAYLPVEVEGEYPGERVEYMLEDAGVRVLLVDGEDGEDGQGKLAFAFRGRVVEWEKAWREIEREESGNLALETGPGNLAYVIYTSGSTGKPKAVMVQHGSLANLVDWHQRTYYVEPADRATQTAALGFDASVWEIWPYLTSGASLWIVPDHVRSSGTGMIDWLVERRITLCFLVTPLAEILLKGYSERKPFEWSLRALFTGGDKLTYVPPQARFELWNHYGPTENTVVATAARIVPGSNRQPPIGRPIRNTRVYILDRYLQPAPLGTTGEIYIAGAALARGYRNRPQLTAERFVANPYSSDGDRLYRSGDLARWNRDGGIEFIGRGDSQVKIRGFRIELGEIEAALRNCEGVQDAVVIAHGDATGDKRLLGYVLAGRSSEVNAKGLHARLKRELPEYMDPALMVLESWPLTPNGKIDRKALPTPEFVPENAYRAPRTPEEEILCELFAGILGVPRVGLTDNFFALGGHSLMAIRLVSRIKATFRLDLAVYDLFHAPSVEELSPRLLKREDRSRIALTKPLRPERLPMSYGQERLWFVDRLEGGASTEYNVPVALRLKGELDQGLLERALNTIVERHESLRTHFVEKDGEPEQVIEERVRIELGMEDVSGLGEVEREERVEEAIRREWEERFDLERGPVLRAKLLKMGEREHVLVRTMHHIVSDGWSEGIFHGEMMALYGAYREGGENPLEELPVQYADYALWQRARMGEGGREMEEGLSYWKKELEGIAEELELPRDRRRGERQTFGGGVWKGELSEEQVEGLKRVGQEKQATMYMTLLGILGVLLWRYSGQEDVVVGTPVANRPEAELEGLIGFFVNTVVMRVRVEGRKRVGELLEEVRESALRGYRHQGLPFERLVEELMPERSLNRTPVFQVVFALQNAGREWEGVEGLEVERVEGKEKRVRFDLEVQAWEGGKDGKSGKDGMNGKHGKDGKGGMELSFGYNVDLFDEWRVVQMGRHYVRLVEEVIGGRGERIGEMDFLEEGERRQIVEEWNATREEGRGRTVVEEFEEQVARGGERVAVVDEEGEVSYRDLNERANRLGRYLRRMGVGVEEVVGIGMKRTVRLVVGILGIMKAGGAYLPVEVEGEYPGERVEYMLEDAGVRVLLVDGEDGEDGQGKLAFAFRGRVVEWEKAWREIEREESGNLALETGPGNLAYVIYTSGSTGKPKAVMVQHDSLMNFLSSMRHRSGIASRDALLAVTTLSFDIAALEIYLPLVTGARFILMRREDAADGELLARKLTANNITFMQATPATWRLLLSAGWQGRARLKILCGGEALSADLAVSLFNRCGSLWNMYGPTETTIWSSMCEVTEPVLVRDGIARGGGGENGVSIQNVISIGHPLGNTQLYVLDRGMNLVPLGVPGELYIGGMGLARGYLHRSWLTAERFVPDPFSAASGARLYRTGDLVRHSRQGMLEFLGRNDHQVKIRGFRIELGEIETCLARHPDIREVVVTSREETSDGRQLVAYYTRVDQGAERSLAAHLRAWLADRLPGYMVPDAYVHLDAMPLTAIAN